MKRFCLFFLMLMLLTVSAAAGRTEGGAYTPSTELEARCVPVYVPLIVGEETGWHTLYNPETADMCVELADASTSIGSSTAWKTAMTRYGYEQLYCTEDNEVYASGSYLLGKHYVNGNEVPFDFPAVNALIGIQEVTYNGQTRYAIGLVFRGSSDLSDWMTDFTAYSDEAGFHKGFAQNAEDFCHRLCDQVFFSVEGKRLSLTEILTEMKTPNSRFCMLVMGHSLGGALTNVVVGREFYDMGVHPSNLAAYALATPRSAPNSYKYPYDNIYNIISADDLVPQATLMGHKHIGKNIVFRPTDGFRAVHYGSYALDHVGEPNVWWQTTGFFGSGCAPHLIDTAYRPLVKLVSEEIVNSTPEKHSTYTDFSTSGYNRWILGDAIISPYTFGDFTGSIETGSLHFENGGVMRVEGDLRTNRSLHMHHEDDYLLVCGDLNSSWGVHSDHPDHLTAGTVELKGDLSTGRFNFWDVPYHATGTHRTVISGTKAQNLHFYGDDISIPNLYLRNSNVTLSGNWDYVRLAEDAVISASENLYIHELDLNGYSFVQNGKMGTRSLHMNGGNLRVTGDLDLHTPNAVDGAIHVGGNLTLTEMLTFDQGQVHVAGDCYLPGNLIMRNEEDYLFVGGELKLKGWADTPADHLSAGTVELQGNLKDDVWGANNYYIYHETGTHRTIFSGTEIQSVWFKTATERNVLQVCLRNPLTDLGNAGIVRLMEDGALAHPERCKIHQVLDLNGYKLAAQGSFQYLKAVIGGSGLMQMTVDPNSQTITVNRPVGSTDPIHILLIGYNAEGKLMIHQMMTFDTEEEMTATLRLENWPECAEIRALLLEDGYIPFCGSMAVSIAGI